MNMDIDYTEKIYKTIDAHVRRDKFGRIKRMRILSKIDKDGNVTVEFYYYYKEDIDKDGSIKNKRDRYITNKISVDKFNEMIHRFPELYPEFEIIGMTDLSNMSLKEAIETMKDLGYGKIIDYDKENSK